LEAGPRPVPWKEERFTSWKEIAAYFKRDVRTVQRWEAKRGLPVHRLPGSSRSPIYALKSELDDWWANTPAQHENLGLVPMRQPLSRHWLSLSLACLAVAAFAGWSLWQSGQSPAPLPIVPLTSLPGTECAPALSPDGKRLAFTWIPADSGNPDIYIVDLPDGPPKRITDDPAADMFAEWSPDGQRLAYTRVVPGGSRYELHLADLRGGSDRTVLESDVPGTVVAPPWVHVWTPDGEGLILSRPRQPGGPLGIVLLVLKTGIEHRLTPPIAGIAGEVTPALSPDGRRLVFQRRTPSGEGNLFIVELKADFTAAGPPRQITNENCCLEAPSWTRDGREVVFVSWKDGTRRLARVRASGGPIRFDPSVPVAGSAPRIAPDGRLLFHDSVTVGNIFRMDLNRRGAGAKRLIASTRRDGSPTYSPDGKRIVFTSDRAGSRQLWMCDNEGGQPQQLTHLDGISAWFPAYSPDSRWVAFEGRRGNQAQIYLANSSTGVANPLLAGSVGQRPRWSRDGRRLYFTSDCTGEYEIWRVAVDRDGRAGLPAQLTRQGGYSGYESADGRYFYYSDWTVRQVKRTPTEGGPEDLVRCNTSFSRYPANLAAGVRGLYYLGQSGENGTPLYFLPFEGGIPNKIATLHHPPSLFGITVSPDERWLLLSVSEQTSGDILCVPGFR
jgi:Tol biopolymer transport system component